jgi:hypothetical protein
MFQKEDGRNTLITLSTMLEHVTMKHLLAMGGSLVIEIVIV